LAGILAKRASLHRAVTAQTEQNHVLKSQIDRIQPLASIGLISSMIAHELNNILTPLANYAQLSIDNPQDVALREKALQKTVLNCERACKIQQSLLALASGNHQPKQHANLRDLIDELFACLCRDFRKEKINIVTDIPDDLEISMVPAQIQQVIMNLILNARDALLATGGTITISASRDEDHALITVADNGSGIPADILPQIFEPFVTTKDGQDPSSSGSGTGLGLAFCHQVVQDHDGAITVESAPGQGTTFKIILPL
jgi:two-component system NtrC family sensor kinase